MNLLLRLIYVLVRARLVGRLGPLEASVLSLRVLPTDLDLFLHVNNGRYLTIMDLGRVDMMVRTGFARAMRRHGWRPLVGSANVRWRRPLTLFQHFTLHTRLACWDEKWIYLDQRIERDGEMVCGAAFKVVFRKGGAVVAPEVIARAMGYDPASPNFPPAIAAWQAATVA